MLVVMQSQATDEQVRAVCDRIESLGFKALPVPGAGRTAVCITGNSGAVDLGSLESMPGVIECIPVSKPYKLVSRDVKAENTVVRVPTALGDVAFGGSEVAMVGGPLRDRDARAGFHRCETCEGCWGAACSAAALTSRALPRTAFRGWAKRDWKSWARCARNSDLGIITEAIDNESLDLVEEYADVIQIGARNMQNFSLLKRAGRAKKPVLLKRGMSATLDEFLMAAEYLMSEGNYAVILCERGVRTFSDFTRNTLDLSVVPAVQKRSHLPIVVDPSHGTGRRNKVLPLSRAAVAVGADGLLVEVHNDPDRALSDGPQSILPAELEQLMREVRQIAAVLGRTIN